MTKTLAALGWGARLAMESMLWGATTGKESIESALGFALAAAGKFHHVFKLWSYGGRKSIEPFDMESYASLLKSCYPASYCD